MHPPHLFLSYVEHIHESEQVPVCVRVQTVLLIVMIVAVYNDRLTHCYSSCVYVVCTLYHESSYQLGTSLTPLTKTNKH